MWRRGFLPWMFSTTELPFWAIPAWIITKYPAPPIIPMWRQRRVSDCCRLPRDAMTYVRFINFSPDSALNLVLASNRDTIQTGFREFAGNRLKTSSYTYKLMHIGLYEARAWRDTVAAHSIPLGNIQIDSLKNYSLFLQGYADSSGEYGLRLKSVRQN